MGNTQTYETVIRLNSEQAKKEIAVLQQKTDELRRKQSGLAPDSKEWQKLEKQIQKTEGKMHLMENRTNAVKKALNSLSSAKPQQIRDVIKDINRLLNSGSIERGSKEWRQLTSALKEAKTELRKIGDETKASQSGLSRFMKFLNDSWGGLTLMLGSITGVSMTIRKVVSDYAEMEEEMANVRKYTGLADSAVRELNDDLKKMDTRTSREQLNQLAGSAGRLGLQGKRDILDFVEAGDMIQVALGDDLGEGAIDQIGKLTMAFGEDKTKGLRGAMLATGSAVNELAQNSTAKAGYLVDFTARVGAFGRQIGLTQAQLMGFAAVMDEGMLRDEMAATAFGNMLTKMRSETDKFARIAGMDVKEFTRLLDEDANGAILRLADNMKRQDPTTFMKMLDDMGLDGSRAVTVISTLADKIDDVRRHQERATKAYNEGTSVVNEYNVMNHTAQAELDKAKKAFHEITVELGEKLKPVVTWTISAGGATTKIVGTLTDFLLRNGKTIIWLTTVIGTYIATQKIRALWEERITLLTKAQTAAETVANGLTKVRIGLLGALKVAYYAYSVVLAEVSGNMAVAADRTKQLNYAMSSTPWGAVLTAVVAFAGGIVLVIDKVTELMDKEKRLREVEKEVSDGINEEMTRLETLTGIIKSNASTEDERKRALEELNGKLMEKHLGNLTEEAVRTGQATTALERYLELKGRELKMKALEQEIIESQKTLDEVNRDLESFASFNLAGMWKAFKMEDFLYGGLGIGTKARLELTKSVEEASIKRLREEMQAMLTVTPGTGGHTITRQPTDDEKKPTFTPYVSSEEEKKRAAERKKQEEQERKRQAEERARLRQRNDEVKAANDELLAMNLASYAAGEIDYRTFVRKQNEIRLVGIEKRMEIYDQESDEYKKLQLKRQQLQLQGDEDLQAMRLEDIDREHRAVVQKIEAGFYDERSIYYMNERERDEALHRAEVIRLQDRIALLRKGSREWLLAKDELDQIEYEHQLKNQQYYQEALESLRENYFGQTSQKRMTLELNALEDLYQNKLIKEEEYQEAKLQIQARYATDSSAQTIDAANAKASGAFAVARQQAGDANTSNAWTGDVANLMAQMKVLKQMREQDKLDHAEYLAAKAMAVEDFLQKTQAKYGALFEQLGSLYDGASAYAKACSDYETAVVTSNYDRQIAAAGNNTKKREKLEKKKQEEINRIKTKANDRAMKMEMAQAMASMAMGAINAYASAAKVPLIGYILAPAAAAAAIAAGMLQVAAIKKQHQAEAAGYYEGGFTGGRNYRKEAGVVHEGEFVANHNAVQNPAILPFLNFLDQAQRNNTVGTLTAEDVSRSMGAGGSSQIVAPIVNVQTDNEDMREALYAHREATYMLLARLQHPIDAKVVLTGPDGLNEKKKELDRMLKNK